MPGDDGDDDEAGDDGDDDEAGDDCSDYYDEDDDKKLRFKPMMRTSTTLTRNAGVQNGVCFFWGLGAPFSIVDGVSIKSDWVKSFHFQKHMTL